MGQKRGKEERHGGAEEKPTITRCVGQRKRRGGENTTKVRGATGTACVSDGHRTTGTHHTHSMGLEAPHALVVKVNHAHLGGKGTQVLDLDVGALLGQHAVEDAGTPELLARHLQFERDSGACGGVGERGERVGEKDVEAVHRCG